MSVAYSEAGGGTGKDGFWDSKWEGMELDERLREAENKGEK